MQVTANKDPQGSATYLDEGGIMTPSQATIVVNDRI